MDPGMSGQRRACAWR